VRIERVDSREAGSKLAAQLFADFSNLNPTKPVGLATGATMSGVYQELAKQGFSPSCQKAFALDEYLGLTKEHKNSYFYELNEQFVKRLGFKGELLVPGQPPFEGEEGLALFEQEHRRSGPLSVQLLGLGSNGHIAFNEPGSSFDSLTRVVELHPQTLLDNARFFEDPSEMPKFASTQGIATIMRASELLLLVFGETKQAALTAALSKADGDSPASALLDHPNLTLITDLDLG